MDGNKCEQNISSFLNTWCFSKVDCHAPMDYLISNGLFRAKFRKKRYRIYEQNRKGYSDGNITEYWLLLDHVLYKSRAYFKRPDINEIVSELEDVLRSA